MLLAISDDDRKLKRFAPATFLFLILNIVVFLYQKYEPDYPKFEMGFSAVPFEITNNTDLVQEIPVQGKKGTVTIPHAPGPNPIYLTLFSAMFMHGSWLHLAGNMLFLWIFGDNVENRFGTIRFVLFYVISGIIATISQILIAPDSLIPSLGASGAIAGILGAYLVMFPHNKVKALFFIKIVTLPAWVVIGVWIAMQFFGGWGTILEKANTGGIAYAAHIGGFIAGFVMGMAFRLMLDGEPDSILERSYRAEARDRQARKREKW